MRNAREVLRQKLLLKKTHREVAASLNVSVGAITGVLHRAGAAGIDVLDLAQLSDDGLEERLYGALRDFGIEQTKYRREK